MSRVRAKSALSRSRTTSGSLLTVKVVDPTMSAKRTVTSRRSCGTSAVWRPLDAAATLFATHEGGAHARSCGRHQLHGVVLDQSDGSVQRSEERRVGKE